MSRGAGHLFLTLEKWKLIAARDADETAEFLRQQASAPLSKPPAQDRVLFAAADEVLGWAVARKDQS